MRVLVHFAILAAIFTAATAVGSCAPIVLPDGSSVDLNSVPSTLLSIPQIFQGQQTTYDWSFDLCRPGGEKPPNAGNCTTPGYIEEFSKGTSPRCERSFSEIQQAWSVTSESTIRGKITSAAGPGPAWLATVTLTCGSDLVLKTNSPVNVSGSIADGLHYNIELKTSAVCGRRPLVPKWNYTSSRSVEVAVLDANDIYLLLGETNSKIVALDAATGAVRWEHALTNYGDAVEGFTVRVIDSTRLLVYGSIASLMVLHRSDGSVIINTTAYSNGNYEVWSQCPIADGHVLLLDPSTAENVISVDLSTGAMVWRSTSLGDVQAIDPTYVGQGVLLVVQGVLPGNWMGLNTTDGSILWTQPLPGVWPVTQVQNSAVISQIGDRGFGRFEPTTWSTKWSNNITSDGSIQDFVLNGSNIFTSTTNAIHAVSIHSGENVWTHYPPGIFPPSQNNVYSRGVTVAGDYVLGPGWRGNISVLDANSGSPIATLPWDCATGQDGYPSCGFPENSLGAFSPGSSQIFLTSQRINNINGESHLFFPVAYDLSTGREVGSLGEGVHSYAAPDVYATPHGALYVGDGVVFLLQLS